MNYGKQNIIVLFVLLIVFLSFKSCWNVVLSNVIPWIRTAFSDHESYLDLLDDRHCFGVIYSGVLCNDETGELIEFNYYGPMGRGMDADKEKVD